MEQGWDHTENEDKHLLTQVIDMSQVKVTQMAITSPNITDRVSAGGGCTIGSQELVSLSGESSKHLSSVVINNINNINIHSNLFFNLNISSYGDFKIYIHNLSVVLNNIYNLIRLSYKNMDSSVKIVKCVNPLVCKSSLPIIICFNQCLDQIKTKIIELHHKFLDLGDKFGYIDYFKKESLKTMNSCEDISIVKSKLYKLIDKFKCSITNFNQIESSINCIKSKIREISQLKQNLCKQFEKIILHMCINISIDKSTLTIKISYFNKKWLGNKIKSLSKDIDALCSDVIIIQSHSDSLKSINSNILNFLISNNIKQNNPFYSIFYVDIDEVCSLIKCLYCWICKISCICNSNCQCKCTCKCESTCTGNTICLCLCDCAKGEKGDGCCICICKKEDKSNCKCICICLCNKKDCGSEPHECKECSIRVDVKSLLSDTSTILCSLRWVRWYISILEKKCCYCSCCVNGPCGTSCCIRCRSIINYYKSIISRINSIELLFKEVSAEIVKLSRLYKTLSLISSICTKCQKCGCKDKIDGLIKHIESGMKYYSSFASVVGDIKLLVDYKTFSPQSNEIIEKLKMSVNPLLNQLYLVNQQLLGDSTYTGTLDKFLVCVYSHYCIFQCFLDMYILLQCSTKISSTIYNIIWLDMCECPVSNSLSNHGFKISDFENYLIQGCNKGLEDLNKLIVNREGNHKCLCLVIKYVLYPTLVRSFYILRQIYWEAIGKQTKEFIRKMFIGIEVKEVTKLIYAAIITLDKIIFWIKNKYYYGWLVYTKGVYIQCFCKNYDDPYYPYLISTILFVSSLIENIWTMDTQILNMSIEKLSCLLSEYQSIHVYTNYTSKKSTRDTTGSTDLSKLKLVSTNLAQYINMLSIKTTSKNGTCNSGRNGNGTSQIVLHTHLSKSEALLLNSGFKAFFKTVLSSLYILITTPLFTLAYSNISGLSFYLIQNGKSIGLSSLFLRRGLMGISINYLNDLCKKRECTCPEKNGYKICLVGKVVSLGLSITMRKIQVVLSNVSGDMLLNYLKESTNRSEDFITNLCVGFGEVYTIMLKNHLLTNHKYATNINSTENMGVKDASSSNWGYDTGYEHQITTSSSYSDNHPFVFNCIYIIIESIQ